MSILLKPIYLTLISCAAFLGLAGTLQSCDKGGRLTDLLEMDSASVRSWDVHKVAGNEQFATVFQDSVWQILVDGLYTPADQDYIQRSLRQVNRFQGEEVNISKAEAGLARDSVILRFTSKDHKTESFLIGKEFFSGEPQKLTYYIAKQGSSTVYKVTLPLVASFLSPPEKTFSASALRIDMDKLRSINIVATPGEGYEIYTVDEMALVSGKPAHKPKVDEFLSELARLNFIVSEPGLRAGAQRTMIIQTTDNRYNLLAYKDKDDSWLIERTDLKGRYARATDAQMRTLFPRESFFFNPAP